MRKKMNVVHSLGTCFAVINGHAKANPLTSALCRKAAFTLAEVLVTLSILGIVAAIMIPGTMHRIQDTQQLTGFKRAWSMFDNALYQMYAIEGLPSTWSDWPSTSDTLSNDNLNHFAQKLANYLPVQKYCGDADGCFSYGHKSGKDFIFYPMNYNGYLYDTRTEKEKYGKMILKNNMRVSLSSVRHPNTYSVKKLGACLGIIRVDINGEKGPNRLGHDVFSFAVDEKGIQTKPGNYCLTTPGQSQTWKEACNKNNPVGINSCSIWIMKHNNMDYKYRDVSAEW